MTALIRIPGRHPLTAVIAAAFLTRVAMLVYFLRSRPDIFTWGINECGVIAGALVHGHGFTGGFHDYFGPTTWFAPAYPLILAALFHLFGTQTFAAAVAAYVLNILCALLTAVLIVKIGTRLCSPATGVVAGLVWGLTPQAALPEFLLADGTVATLLMCLAVFLTLDVSQRGVFRWFLCGTTWGLSGLASPATLAPLPLMLIYLYKKKPTMRPAPVVVVACVLATLAPWMIRDAKIFHRFVPVRDNGLAEIYFANVGYDENPSGPSMQYQRLGEEKFVAVVERKLILYLRAHPLKFVRDSLVRVYRFWTAPEGLFGYSAAVSLLSFVGLGMLVSRSWLDSLPFVAVMALYPMVYYSSVTFSRYRQPVDPFLYILGSYAFIKAVAQVKKRSHLGCKTEVVNGESVTKYEYPTPGESR